MNNDKLKQIIAHKNERLEQEAVNRASEIINEIAEYQQAKKDADKAIEKLRVELKTLEIDQINETSILGD
jgi:hypothetical protein